MSPRVILLSADACRGCPYFTIRTTALEDGKIFHQNECSRKDCDNYRTQTLLPPPLTNPAYLENVDKWLNS